MKWQESEGYKMANRQFAAWWHDLLFKQYPTEIGGVFVMPRDAEWVLADMLDKLEPKFMTFADKATAAWLNSDLPGMLKEAVGNFVRRKLDEKGVRCGLQCGVANA